MQARDIIAALVCIAVCQPAIAARPVDYQGKDYAFEGASEVRYVIDRPFGRNSLAAYEAMARTKLPKLDSPIISYTYRIDKQNQVSPSGNQVFSYRRIAVFDTAPIFDEFNAIAARFRKNGCSKTKVSDAQLIGRSSKALTVRIEFKHKERKCSGSFATDVGGAEGDVVFSVNLVERQAQPHIEIRKESSSFDASVLGMNVNSLAGRFIGGLLRALGVLYANPVNIGDAIGSFELAMMKPLRTQVARQLAQQPDGAIPAPDLQQIRTAFGDISTAFQNYQATTMNFNHAASGFVTRPVYRANPSAPRRLSNEICTEIVDLPTASQYCQSIGSSQLVLVMVDETKPRTFLRSSYIELSSREARAMESTKTKSFKEAWPENSLLPNIARRHYGSEAMFLRFFNTNNQNAECYIDSIVNKRMCSFQISPLWQYYEALIERGQTTRHPLAPGSPFRAQLESSDADFGADTVY